MKPFVKSYYCILVLLMHAPVSLYAQYCPDGALYNAGSPLPAKEHYKKMVAMCTYGAPALCTQQLKDWLALPLDGQVLFEHAKENMSLKSSTLISLNRLFTLFDSDKEDERKGRTILEYQLLLLEDNLWLAYYMLEGNLSSNAVDVLNKTISYELDLSSSGLHNLSENDRVLLSSFSRLLRRGEEPASLSQYERDVWIPQIARAGQLHLVYAYAKAAIAFNIETKFGLRNPSALPKQNNIAEQGVPPYGAQGAPPGDR